MAMTPFIMKADPAWFSEVDDWCKRQPGKAPSRAAAIRTLVARALRAEGAQRPRPII